ncbi:unannotated protein [freshwater metagenome]|uniref:Unannotated protein n=1 Tax=freshwater metagenome TaxID=449393 RepID=A0A6J7FTU1_9ZZZZ
MRVGGGCRCGLMSEKAVQGLTPRLRLHDHSRATAIGGVVNGVVHVVGEVAQVDDVEFEDALLAGLAHE